MVINLASKNNIVSNFNTEESWNGHDKTKLDFSVVEKPLFSENVEIPDKKVIFRADADKLDYFATVSKKYSIIKHVDIIDRLEKGMDLNDNVEVKTILANNGAKMNRIYTLKNYVVEIAPGDEISPSIRIVNSYDGSTAIGFYIDAIRWLCENGMVATRQFMSMNYRHFGNRFNIDTFAHQAKILIEGFKNYSENWKEWAGEYISDDRAHLIIKYMPVRFRPAIESRLDNNFDGTKWGLYNAFTEAITHDYIPVRSKTPDTQKINIGAETTKIFATKWYWEADEVDIMKDLSKKSKVKK